MVVFFCLADGSCLSDSCYNHGYSWWWFVICWPCIIYGYTTLMMMIDILGSENILGSWWFCFPNGYGYKSLVLGVIHTCKFMVMCPWHTVIIFIEDWCNIYPTKCCYQMGKFCCFGLVTITFGVDWHPCQFQFGSQPFNSFKERKQGT